MRLPLLFFALAISPLAAALAPARCLPRTRYLRCCVEVEVSSLEDAGQAEASWGSEAALECPIAVRAVRGKGFGAFAVAAVPAGARVCSYHGEALTQRRVAERYGAGAASQADYLFELRPPSAEAEGLYVDAARSQHPSRFINHAEDGNLVPSPVGRPHERIDFYAARPIQPGEELCFDYGVRYWAARSAGPVPESDTRWVEIRLRRLLGRLGPLLVGVVASVPL